MGSYRPAAETAQILETLKRATAALRSADVPFALAGSVACWARGGPPPYNDVDFAVREADGERGLRALVEAGMRAERPPEGWLAKARDDDVLVDLIFDFEGVGDVDELLARAEILTVESVPMPVLDVEDVMVSKLCALDEHALDLAGPLLIARALREQIDWAEVRRRTAASPYAHGFLAMLEALQVVAPASTPPGPPPASTPPGPAPASTLPGPAPRVRVVSQG
jgi:hypothetical protein